MTRYEDKLGLCFERCADNIVYRILRLDNWQISRNGPLRGVCRVSGRPVA